MSVDTYNVRMPKVNAHVQGFPLTFFFHSPAGLVNQTFH